MPDYPMTWWEYRKLVNQGPFMTSAEHRIIVKRESIPIVFIPGIMGSRLKRGSRKIWDPNSSWFMLKTYLNAPPSKRRELLMAEGLEPDTDTSDEFKQRIQTETFVDQNGGYLGMANAEYLPPSIQQQNLQTASDRGDMAVKQGWGGVAWSFYGNLIQALAGESWNPFDKCFVLPVYAVAYNWVQDNLMSGYYLTEEISKIIQNESAKGLICEKVIVISHSMGGMVSRAAAKMFSFEGKMLGIVHGAQPVLGAPAAYRRMRAGFESGWNPTEKLGSAVLGATTEDVMPVLGNSVGGLELLPTHLYKTNDGQTRWLKMHTNDNIETLPNGSPYESIYKEDSAFLRLIYHPEYLDPPSDQEKKLPESSTANPSKRARISYEKNIRKAEDFHQRLKLQCHPITYSAWVAGGSQRTWDKIDYKFLQTRYPQDFIVTPEGFPVQMNPSEGTGIDYWESNKHPEQNGYYKIAPQTGEGDGTVPRSSGSALGPMSRKTKVITGVEHSDFYNSDKAQKFVVNCVKEIAKLHFDQRMS